VAVEIVRPATTASTTASGSTPPDVSRTEPLMATVAPPCAATVGAAARSVAHSVMPVTIRTIRNPFVVWSAPEHGRSQQV
jgi:hypothetical protein